MKRIAKIIDRDAIIPELKYLVLCEHGAIVWNGAVGMRFDLSHVGQRLAALVKQHKRFAFVDALRFLSILAVLEKVDEVHIDRKESVLVIRANGDKTVIKIPVVLDLDKSLPHLNLRWDTQQDGVTPYAVEGVWLDAEEMLTAEGVALWGDAVGVYSDGQITASFDYGILLYRETGKKRLARKTQQEKAPLLFCPHSLLSLGLAGIKQAVKVGDALYLIGDGVEYFTTPAATRQILDNMLGYRELAASGTAYNVTMDFSNNLWKRAKLFNKAALTMQISGGRIILQGTNWSDIIGTTDAPDALFVTRISLLNRWTVGSNSHKFYVSEDGNWYLGGVTRKGSEFYGSLTELGTVGNSEAEVSDNYGAEVEDTGSVTSLL